MSEEEIRPEAKKGHGCFFYGCLTVVIIAILAAVGVGLVVFKVRNIAMSFTSDKPVDIPVVVLPAEEMAALDARVMAFQQAMTNDQPARLVLTAAEINAKLNSSREFAQMGGKANVRLEGDRITAALSMPTDPFGLKGRYLNGTAQLRIGLEAGRLVVFVDQIEANGKAPPESIMKELRSKNLAEDSMKDPDTAATIAKLKRIAVENGTIVVEK